MYDNTCNDNNKNTVNELCIWLAVFCSLFQATFYINSSDAQSKAATAAGVKSIKVKPFLQKCKTCKSIHVVVFLRVLLIFMYSTVCEWLKKSCVSSPLGN